MGNFPTTPGEVADAKNALVPRAAPKAVGGMELAWGRVQRVLEKPTPTIREG